jgi:hypothetical protein
MRNFFKPGVILAVLLIGLGSTAGAEEKASGAAAKKHSAFEYNPQSVVTLKGIITAISPGAASDLPEPVFLTLQTEQGKVQVFVGPNWFVEEQGVKLAALDRVEVTGSRMTDKGRIILFAAEIKKGDRVLKLRTPEGRPFWGGQKEPPRQEKTN